MPSDSDRFRQPPCGTSDTPRAIDITAYLGDVENGKRNIVSTGGSNDVMKEKFDNERVAFEVLPESLTLVRLVQSPLDLEWCFEVYIVTSERFGGGFEDIADVGNPWSMRGTWKIAGKRVADKVIVRIWGNTPQRAPYILLKDHPDFLRAVVAALVYYFSGPDFELDAEAPSPDISMLIDDQAE